MSNLPLKELPWEQVKYSGGVANDAQGAGIYYRAIQRDGKHIVFWVDSMGGSDGDKSFDSWDELKDWVQTTHYPHKMQPYVVPSPNKVFELTYDYGDGYFTVFMTTDNQQALDFIESVKKSDTEFVRDYGFDDDADELLIEQYEDNHPLKPYASKIFHSIYEDSFSEWVDNYDGESFASQLSIIEHELLTSKQGE